MGVFYNQYKLCEHNGSIAYTPTKKDFFNRSKLESYT